MKKLFLIALFFTFYYSQAQTVFGKWKTIDDNTGEAKSIIEIYENSGKVYGKIVDILDPTKRNFNCIKCTDANNYKSNKWFIFISIGTFYTIKIAFCWI